MLASAAKNLVDEIIKSICEKHLIEFAEEETDPAKRLEQLCKMLQYERKWRSNQGWYKGCATEAWYAIQEGREYRERLEEDEDRRSTQKCTKK